ncbi:hypothetical protein Nepgr_029061 [Nepenthes gracilis]|uniref:Protein PLASTID MOVEMENT IMPAIRED 2 n=1 Tax=Nepenthes gracilis TaxID=150966 RepID=A0AAD3TDJ1_NEPGR|nr:hypothetical protein Nepgr_029061 [Nepenthes gracilis]
MDGEEIKSRREPEVVKAAINMYGQRVLEGTSATKKSQMVLLEKQPSRARELHLVRKNIVQIDDNRRVVETVMAEAELELLKAKKIVKDLTLQIEESNSTTRQKKQELHKLNKGRKFEERENHQCAEVVREVESAKQELSKLKLDKALVLEEKSRAEKEAMAASSKMQSYLHSSEAIRKEIEEANEEIVLVELAQIEATKELAAIEAQRKEEAQNFSSSMEKIRNKMSILMEETDNVKDLEVKLAITSSDIQQLQNELNLVKEFEKKGIWNGSSEHSETSSQESLSQSRAIKEELEAAKKELASIREEGFQLMMSMDMVREERKHVSKEMARTKKSKEKLGKSIENLHVKLLTAKDKLEAVSVSEGNATAMLSSLSLPLDQLKEAAEAAMKERELINAETASMKSDVRKTLSKIDLAEERVQSVVQELEAVKSSEMMALDKLRSLTENASRARALAAQHHSTISISRFEYEYLRGCAASAKEIADRKVAAAEAWIKALRTSEKEIMMKTEIAQKEIDQLRLKEEQELHETDKLLTIKESVDAELQNRRDRQNENFGGEKLPVIISPKRSRKESGNLTPLRRAMPQKSASPSSRHLTHSSSFTRRRRRKVMLNFPRFLQANRLKRVPKLEEKPIKY